MSDGVDLGLMLWEELLCFLPCGLSGWESGQLLWQAQYYARYGNDGLERRMARRMEVCALGF